MNEVLINKDEQILDPKIPRYEKLKGEVIYSNSNGSNSTITLNKNIDNAKFIDIFYKNNNNFYNCVRVYEPLNKQVALSVSVSIRSANTGWVQTSVKQISSTQISNYGVQYGEIQIPNGSYSGNNVIYITKVIAYY